MINRRFFCKTVPCALLLSFMGLNASDKTPSTDEVFSILDRVSKLVFPQIKALNIDALSYFKLVLSHSKISKKDKNFLINGCLWLDEIARQNYQISFVNLSQNEQNRLLNLVIKEQDWGENWVYDLLIFCSEATFGDPIYGANIDANGWKWVAHETGLPQPKVPFL
ncbi:putative gluconate 2-dehydrogenase subunit [Campylobacter iguaniorum]|uniref:Putative gluconate 2-dehydrogenase subunit n=1 Tax=Campylobacter iguaniorum TaxID=1244531 RepID=A0A076FDN5_9BACT|nr:gluconate 2-dehydrogenase subunit 3 family protein [Campylobacter iguaniorum]AII15507.1 putative gluconate 2-dehydrogenase subunit [Campylobacter iguaniorum]ALV25421.1 putative gluconate 2-dehydrogenase subunit [Campylobacter iguaniorum]